MTRIRLVALVAVAAVGVGVLVYVTRSDNKPTTSGPRGQTSGPPLTTTPQPQRRFINVGTTNHQQFTPAQFQILAQNYEYIFFAKFHGGWDINLHHEAARTIKSMNPSVHVLPYFSTKYWFDNNRWGVTIDPAFLLRDNTGQLVHKQHAGQEQEFGTYVDLANPDYRNWALNLLSSWLQAAPYDGIFFDAADPIGDFNDDDIQQWDSLLGADRVAAYNAGIRDLIDRAKQLVGPSREIVYNGISPAAARGPGRDLDLLDVSDGALDERFCIDPKGRTMDVGPDLQLLGTVDKRLFMHTAFNDKVDAADQDRLLRYCFGSFLLAWRPGLSYFQVGTDYTADQLARVDAVLRVDLGSPTQQDQVEGDLGVRQLDRKSVV